MVPVAWMNLPSGETQIAEVRTAACGDSSFAPEDFRRFRAAPLEAIRGGTPQDSASSSYPSLLENPGRGFDIVIANAAAALVVTESRKISAARRFGAPCGNFSQSREKLEH